MRYLKPAIFAVAAAAALMAFAGAGTASAASTLCKVKMDPCPAGSSYTPAPIAVSASQKGTAQLDGTFPVKCSGAGSAAGSVTSNSGTGAVQGVISTLSFTGCKIFGVISCTVETTLGSTSASTYSAEAESTGGGNGSFTVQTGSKEPSASLNCGASGTCSFSEGDLNLKFDGSSTEPLLTALGSTETDLKLKAGSAGVCGSTAEWTATYKISTPVPAFLATGGP